MTNEQACILEEMVVQAKREKSYAVWCKRIGWGSDAHIASGKRAQIMQEARKLKERSQ